MLVDFGEKKEEALETRLRKKNYDSSGADDDDEMMMMVIIMIMRKINSPSVYKFLNFRLLNRAF